MTIFAIIICLYAITRFLGLARYVWGEGYSPIFAAFEIISALAMLIPIIVLTWQ